MTQAKTPWDLNVRVRERNLKKGILDAKDVERHQKDLPDLSAQADIVDLPQPGLDGGDD